MKTKALAILIVLAAYAFTQLFNASRYSISFHDNQMFEVDHLTGTIWAIRGRTWYRMTTHGEKMEW